jgi:4'-phosphopantetheinyl transferase
VLAANEFHVWRADLAGEEADLTGYAALLSADEQARAQRFVFAPDRNRYVAVRGLLRRLLGCYLHVSPETLHFGYSPRGKPFLAGSSALLHQEVHFNVAHSGDIALVAVARARRVGVDVERVRPTLDVRALAQSVFSPAEQAVLEQLPDEAARPAFFAGWARKEAFVKAQGDGISYALAGFSVTLLADAPPQLHLPAAEQATGWTLHALEVGPGYAAAAVSEGPAQLRCFAADHFM